MEQRGCIPSQSGFGLLVTNVNSGTSARDAMPPSACIVEGSRGMDDPEPWVRDRISGQWQCTWLLSLQLELALELASGIMLELRTEVTSLPIRVPRTSQAREWMTGVGIEPCVQDVSPPALS